MIKKRLIGIGFILLMVSVIIMLSGCASLDMVKDDAGSLTDGVTQSTSAMYIVNTMSPAIAVVVLTGIYAFNEGKHKRDKRELKAQIKEVGSVAKAAIKQAKNIDPNKNSCGFLWIRCW